MLSDMLTSPQMNRVLRGKEGYVPVIAENVGLKVGHERVTSVYGMSLKRPTCKSIAVQVIRAAVRPRSSKIGE